MKMLRSKEDDSFRCREAWPVTTRPPGYRAERELRYGLLEDKLYSRLAMKYRAEIVELWITR